MRFKSEQFFVSKNITRLWQSVLGEFLFRSETAIGWGRAAKVSACALESV